MVTVNGQVNDFTRIPTGLCSLDTLLADHLGNRGWPGSTITELYGPPLIGKSTLAVYIAGKLSSLTGGSKIPLLDLEMAYSEDHLAANLTHAGFRGEAWLIEMVDKKGKSRSHEEVLEEWANSLTDPLVSAIVLDSIGMVMSESEVSNPIGSANMGRRGFIMAQTSRKLIYHLRQTDRPKFVVMVNHEYQNLGPYGGRVTPGGKAKEYLSSQRITMYNKEKLEWGDMHVAMRCDKKRKGGVQKDARGYVYIIPDYGVSPEMTAAFDCLIAGYAERKTSGLWLDGKNYGRIRDLRDKVISGDTEWAIPFMNMLTKGFQDEEKPDEVVP